MPHLALKIDVDTERGTRCGVPRLAALLERANAGATFLFSVGPDHTGRAVRRVFRRGFVGKVRRTSVLQHYGLRTLMYGTLLPGPHIGRRHGALMRGIAARGFEVGVHTYDHSKWQDGVGGAGCEWTRRELTRAQEQFAEIFGHPAAVHGAAGWQLNKYVPWLERELGFQYASDVRGAEPFLPTIAGKPVDLPQLPTTLPTLDELIGRVDLEGAAPVDHLLGLTAAADRDHVFTLHAELEGGALLDDFGALLKGWRAQGYELCDLRSRVAALDLSRLPRHHIVLGQVAGRSGELAVQGPRVGGTPARD